MKGLKLHTPTFHKGGRKYRIGSYGELKTSRRGSIGFSWRSGWRQHDTNDLIYKTRPSFGLRSIRDLVRPSANSAKGFSGNYKNALRSTVYG